MAQVVVFAESVPTEVVDALSSVGVNWKAAASLETSDRLAPEAGWTAAIVIGPDFESAIEYCRAMRERDRQTPLLLVVPTEKAASLEVMRDVYDDFVISPMRAYEFEARVKQMMWRATGGSRPELVEYGTLVLNLATYQAAVADRPLDMTYMEYELLKHFATNPGRTFSREELLRQVWGYEYYGGARTVDVHVRRLRAKLGEEHAQLIQTVRSVGYIFGRPRWHSSDES